MNSGDTAWLLASSALVMFMTPGLALFYAGLVRTKNVLATMMHSFVALGVISVLWMIIGYSLGFGTDIGKVIGGLDFAFLNGVGAEPNPLAPTIPHTTYMIFQMMFAIITPALITGAFAERMKFRGYLLFLVLWSLLVYSPVAHWVWGGGWLGLGEGNVGALDFAGGTVVHINAGVAALACVIYMGKRLGYPHEAMRPHNVPMVVTGAAILWFGWFGFNAGSAVGSGVLASSAFVATHLGAAAAVIGWMIPEWLHNKAPTTVGAATGAVAGLVAITPAAGYVEPWAAVIIGLAAGMVCYGAVAMKPKLGYDDSLDVVGVHMVGGIVGALLTGVFATTLINEAAADGLLYGNPGQLGRQAIAVVATLIYSLIATFVILFIVDKLVGLRVSEDEELTGLDLSQHAETAYSLAEGGGASVPLPSGAPRRESVAPPLNDSTTR
ncbi:MAG: ammonium transporter [Actinomycetota bacterium]|nr:ammonium transporter [Actinomycetota bacterium]